MPIWKKIAKLSDLAEGQVKGVEIDGQAVALYKIGGEVFATSDICTHAQCVLSENYLVQGEEVECTCHGSHFNIKTGENTIPPAAEPLKTYPVKIEGEDILIGF